MSEAGLHGDPAPPRRARAGGLTGWRNRLVAKPWFQSWASRLPFTRRIVRRDGEAMFDIVSGFVQSQVLRTLVELDLLRALRDRPRAVHELTAQTGLPGERMAILLQAGAALGLLKRTRDGRFQLAQKGAALLGVPGLAEMIRHHDVLYRDLADPTAFFRGQTTPELAGFWPYVFGAGAAQDPQTAARYSDLMAQSQGLVAQETLRAIPLTGVSHLMDVGGGTGAFLAAAGALAPGLRMTLFDLPAVAAQARARFDAAGMADRVTIHPGSFRDDPLPAGADAISLVRVLYDHQDSTVTALLRACFDALPPGGRLFVSEPMSGGDRPTRSGDVYFSIYTLAMGTGRTRSQARIAEMMQSIGFNGISTPKSPRPFITTVVFGAKPG